MSHKRSKHQGPSHKSHGRPVTDSYHPHASASKHTPRGSAGTRPAKASPSEFARDMRGLEGEHRDAFQGAGAAKRRAKRLEGKPI